MSSLWNLLPKLRLFAVFHSNAVETHDRAIDKCSWIYLLATISVRCPLARVWLHEICNQSLPFIFLCENIITDEEAMVYLKSLRVLVQRGYLSMRLDSQQLIAITQILKLSSLSNHFVRNQVQWLIDLGLSGHENRSTAQDTMEHSMDIWLESIMAGADTCLSDFAPLKHNLDQRLQSLLSIVNSFDHLDLHTSRAKFGDYTLPVQLTKKVSLATNTTPLYKTASFNENMLKIVEAYYNFQPILLHGVSGSGKSSLIQELASTLNMEHNLVILHISDQTDCKALIGSYACTDIPGEFKWVPGILTTAAISGQWILVEDIDQVPLEFIALISPLLESRRLHVAALGKELVAHYNFRVFATRNLPLALYQSFTKNLNDSLTQDNPQFHIHQLRHYSSLWYNILIHPMSMNEVRTMICQLYHNMYTGVADVVLRVLYPIEDSEVQLINLRETLKIVDRIDAFNRDYVNLSGYMTTELRIMIWKEIFELVVLKTRELEALLSLAYEYGNRLGLDKADIEHQLKLSPSISLHPKLDGKSFVKVGRCNLDSDLDISFRNAAISSSYSQTAYARRLLERLAVCVTMNESVLLVGETGNGKTTNVQELARLVGQRLIVLNLSLSSDISDLLGGYRPLSTQQLFKPVYERFVVLFQETLSSAKNTEFLQKTASLYQSQSWRKLLKTIERAIQSAVKKLEQVNTNLVESPISEKLQEWDSFLRIVTRYIANFSKITTGFAFSYVRGLLLEAYQHGYWILLDEINLASAETLQGLSGFLNSKHNSMFIEGSDSNGGNLQKVTRHPAFRVFAAMNPPTDVCKKELPSALRCRFTEIYVPELIDEDDLFQIVTGFFPGMTDLPASEIVKVYLGCRKAADESLVDGSGQRPRYSLRTLTRSLRCALTFLSINLRPLSRCLFEGFYLNFCSMLDEKSQSSMFRYLKDSLWIDDNKKDLDFPPHRPRDKDSEWVLIKPFWIPKGNLESIDWVEKDARGISLFVLTPTVLKYIRSIAAAIAVAAAPILLQGPTSIGKTTMIQYLAARVGRKCVRINNHEHTDIQEYVGGYVTNSDGRLIFKDGLLVEALRNGYWIILDELNLAPSDILEALNRLLDDNQELLISETGEIVKPSPGFQLFATQNPPGIYGGRKPLSLAFRNRFIEIHMGDLPNREIEEIISQSCGIAPKFSAMMVKAMEELQLHRQRSALLLGKHGVITTRDLIKWGKRQPQSNVEVATTGYMLLGEKLRTEETLMVESVMRDVCRVKDEAITLNSIIGTDSMITYFAGEAISKLLQAQSMMRAGSLQLEGVKGIAITSPVIRMWTLLYEALKNAEPVLLVGETGCGKTMICQLYAALLGLKFRAINCHQSTETADLVGGLRPFRSKDGPGGPLFEWVDGPLVEAMKSGDFFLVDEINLAEDAVIERLNSVLEFKKEITLAEKGGHNAEHIVANLNFRIVATMNPSGDFGKRELSPALRSRFTEIWIPASSSFDDFSLIISEILRKSSFNNALSLVPSMISFMQWFNGYITSYMHGYVMTIRELIAWADFINISNPVDDHEAHKTMLNGAFLTLLDGLGIGHNIDREKVMQIKVACEEYLLDLCPFTYRENIKLSVSFLLIPIFDEGHSRLFRPRLESESLVIGDYGVQLGPLPSSNEALYAIDAPTTLLNLGRIARAMSIKRPILLEGPPGVGKTSIITNLAALTGHKLVRINLSEHTELSDLLGSDLPVDGQVESSDGPLFQWYDGILLKAMKEGAWVLLDELNLAPQTVLEGLNACFDHREQVYLPDLGQTVECHPNFRVFTAQNPMIEGGGRKGLPASFLSRFTRVYMESLLKADILQILASMYSNHFTNLNILTHSPIDIIIKMVEFVEALHYNVTVLGKFGRQGSPWEFNLRDMLRWCESIIHFLSNGSNGLEALRESAYLFFLLRMRCSRDRSEICQLFLKIFTFPLIIEDRPLIVKTSGELRIGKAIYSCSKQKESYIASGHRFIYLQGTTFESLLANKPLEALLHGVSLNMPLLLVGPQSSGRRSSIELLGKHLGASIRYFSATPSLDTSEMLGAFEQSNTDRQINILMSFLQSTIYGLVHNILHNYPLDITLISLVSKMFLQVERLPKVDSHDSKISIIEQFVNEMDSFEYFVKSKDEYIDIQEICSQHIIWMRDALTNTNLMRKDGGFVWLNGAIVEAMERGHWLVFDNFNLCSSSALDRLNSVLESNGELVLNEDGTGRTVKRHEGFRIFLVMDSSLGEVSRAMRNRCVEVFYDAFQVHNKTAQILSELERLAEPTTLCLENVSNASLVTNDNNKEGLNWQRKFYNLCYKLELSNSIAVNALTTQLPWIDIVMYKLRQLNNYSYKELSSLSLLYQSGIPRNFDFFFKSYFSMLNLSFGSRSLNLYENNLKLIENYMLRFYQRNSIKENLSNFCMAPNMDAKLIVLSSLLNLEGNYAFRRLLAHLNINKFYEIIITIVRTKLAYLEAHNRPLSDFKAYNYVTVYSRLSTLVEEYNQDMTSPSLYQQSKLVSGKDVIANSRDSVLIGRLWPLMDFAENTILTLSSKYATLDSLLDCQNMNSAAHLLMHVCQIKDLLVRILLFHSVDNKAVLTKLWPSILTIVKWLQKALHFVIEFDRSNSQLIRDEFVLEVFQTFSNFYNNYSLFWGDGLLSEKLTLWKRGGHSSVLIRSESWEMIGLLQNAVKEFKPDLPSFIDKCEHKIISTINIFKSTKCSYAINEWLAIYCTFTWGSTNELGLKLKSILEKKTTANDNTEDLFRKLLEPIASQLQITSLGALLTAEKMNTEEEAQETLFHPNTLILIRAELKDRVIKGSYWYADVMVIDLVSQLTCFLTEILLKVQLSKEDIGAQIKMSTDVIRIGLNHSSFYPELFRSFKSHLWLLEYLHTTTEEVLSDELIVLLKSYLISMTISYYSMTSVNVLHCLPLLDMSYGSKTLASAVVTKDTSGSKVMSENRFGGAVSYARSISINFAVEQIDMHYLCPKIPSLYSLFPQSEGKVEFTIASFHRSRAALDMSFRASVAKNQQQNKGKQMIIDHSGLFRPTIMLRDIFDFNRHLFAKEMRISIDQIKLAVDARVILSIIESNDLLGYIVNPKFQILFKQCLDPLFESSHSTIDANLANFWTVCVASLKVQLVLASLSSDPATRALSKHSMISEIIGRAQCVVDTNIVTSVLAEECVFSEEALAHIHLIGAYVKKDEEYLQKVIHRSNNAAQYENLFSFLKSMLNGPLSCEPLINLSRSLFKELTITRVGRLHEQYIKTLEQQEYQIQTLLYSCYERLNKDFSHYPDVNSVFQECLALISHSLRSLIATSSYRYELECMTKIMNNPTSDDNLQNKIWSAILSTSLQVSSNEIMLKNQLLSREVVTKYILVLLSRQEYMPSPQDSEEFAQILSHQFTTSKIDLLIDSQQLRGIDVLDRINDINSFFVAKYLDNVQSKKEKRQQEASLFTHRQTVHDSSAVEDEDEDEKEFRQNFPIFEDDIAHIFIEDDEAKAEIHPVKSNQGSIDERIKQWSSNYCQDESNLLHVISFYAKAILLPHGIRNSKAYTGQLNGIRGAVRDHYCHVYLVMKLVGSFESNQDELLLDRLQLEEIYCYNHLHRSLSTSSGVILNKNQDELSDRHELYDRDLLYLLDPLAKHRDSEDTILSSSSNYNPWNFLFESNTDEIVAANGVLNTVLNKAIDFLQVLPNNDVLMRIIKLTYTISQFSLSTPLGKLFQSLQHLLKFIQQYEEFAHSKISFSSELSSIFQLIHRYHILQIKSWRNLLRHQEIKYAKKALLFWFSLYKIFIDDSIQAARKFKSWNKEVIESIRWPSLRNYAPKWLFADTVIATDKDTESLSEKAELYLSSQLKLLENFLSDSNVGEFPTRLHLVRLIALSLSHNMVGSYFLQNLQYLVVNLWYSYNQYLPIVREFQQLMLGPIQQQIKDEVKMSKWDNITIIALLENTEKAYRKLQKFLKQYKDDVLDYPVRRLIFKENMKDIIDDTGENTSALEVPAPATLFPTLVKAKENFISSTLLESIQQYFSTYSFPLSIPVENDKIWAIEAFNAHPKCRRIDKISQKMVNYMGRYFKPNSEESLDNPYSFCNICVGINTTIVVEDMSKMILERINNLRGKDIGRPLKQKALRDLLSALRDEGFSHLRSNLPKNFGNLIDILTIGSTLSTTFTKDLLFPFGNEDNHFCGILCKAEKYFIRSLSELNQLRVQYNGTSHDDISNIVKLHMMNLSDSIFFNVLKVRTSLEAGINQSRSSSKTIVELQSILNFLESYTAASIEAETITLLPLSKIKKVCNDNAIIFKGLVAEMSTLISVTEFASEKPQIEGYDVDIEAFFSPNSTKQMGTVCSDLKSVCLKLLECVSHGAKVSTVAGLATSAENTGVINGYEELSLPSIELVRSQIRVATQCKEILQQHYQLIMSMSGTEKISNILQQLTAITEFEYFSPNTVVTPLNIDPLCRSVESLISKVMISIQHMATLHDVLCQGASHTSNIYGCFNELLLDANEILPEQRSLTTLLSWTTAGLANCGVEDLGQIIAKMTSILNNKALPFIIDTKSLFALQKLFERSCDIIELHAKAYAALLDQGILAYKSLTKLLYINLRIFRNLLAKGFCSAEAKEEGGERDGQGNGQGSMEWDDLEGTGMGEGEGKKDVSDQITNEEQLLDLKQNLQQEEDKNIGNQKKDKPSKSLNKEEQEQGVEMEQDFEGETFDLEKTDEKAEESEEEGEELEREMDHDQGEMNMDNVVSEKQWESDEEEDEREEEKEGTEKFEKESKLGGKALEDEMRTKEEGEEEKEKDGKEEGGKEKEGDKAGDEAEENGEKINENFDDTMERPLGAEIEKKKEKEGKEEGDEGTEGGDKEEERGEVEKEMDEERGEFKEYAKDGEEEVGGEGKEGGEGEGQEEKEDGEGEEMDVADLPEEMNIEGEGGEEEENRDEGGEEKGRDLPSNEVMDVEEGGEEEEEGEERSIIGTKEEEKKEEKPLAYGVQDEDGGDEILGERQEELGKDKEKSEAGHHADTEQSSRRDSSKGSGGGSKATAQNKGRGEESAPSAPQEKSLPPPFSNESKEAKEEGESRENKQEEEGGEEQRKGREPPNPFLHRGDLKREWFRRLNIVEERDSSLLEESDDEKGESLHDQGEEEGGEEGRGEGEFEYAERESKGADQVLGAVQREQAVELPEQNELPSDTPRHQREREKKERKRDLDSLQDEEEGGEEGEESEGESSEVESMRKKVKRAKVEDEHENEERMDDEEERSGEEQGEEKDRRELIPPREISSLMGDVDVNVAKTNREFLFGSSTSRALAAEQAEESEGAGGDFQVDQSLSFSPTGSEHVERWQRYLMQTEAYALQLSEQLRLIIEPTLASRLQGDYRTGKRINMRRVISYVASGYRKDKIWLRRTKLAKRSYQVMLLIDDSRSMGLAGDLALQSLALLSTALTRLEIGELAVCSFADQLKVLHPFHETFSTQSGGKIVSQFAFEAHSTRLNDSLRAVLPIFKQAKESSPQNQSASQAVLQLCFVISDARIDSENRTRLDQIVRQMAEQHILVVLVVIDVHENSRDSIFNTRSVSFVNNKVVTTSYLDNFPFPYYVVIQDLRRMPEVLADALKQWFELIKLQLANR